MKLHHFPRYMLLIGLSATALSSHATIYKLEDRANRVTVYSNVPLSSIPSKPETSKTVPSAPTREPQSPPQPPASSVSVSVKPAGSISNDYLRVPPAVQKVRDNERLAILNNELQLEQAALAEALASNAKAEIIHRFRTNIEALKREIAYVK